MNAINREEIKSILRDLLKEIKQEDENESFSKKALKDKVALQKKRNKIQLELIEVDNGENPDEVKRLQDELYSLPKVIEDPAKQTILDCFDFADTVEKAEILGFSYRGGYATVDDLIGDAIRLFEETKWDEISSGRMQIGRLILSKYTEESGCSWFSLVYELNSWEE